MFCKFCGSEIANDSAVCPSCGKDIAGAVPEEPESARDDSVWYYQNDAEMDGPYTYDMLKEKILSGSIPLEARVKQEPGGSWTALCDSPFREAALKKTPAPVAISDKWLWCLAILPLLATTVSAFLGAGAFKGLFGSFLPFMFNVVFFILDRQELLKKGFPAKPWMWLGFFIVPVYLFVREAKTNRNYIPAVIWCFLMAVYLFAL